MDADDETLHMHLLHHYSANPGRSHAIYKLLLEHLRTKNIRHFKNLLEQSLRRQPPLIDVNHPFPSRSNETCLDIACKNGLPEFVEFLLEKGANVNRINEAHNRGPIHFATENGNTDVLRAILATPTVNPNLEAGQQTALHMAVKRNDLNCAELLLDNGASPNIPNNKGLTALHMAVMKMQRNMVNLIIERSKHALDFDTYRDYNGSTTRELFAVKLPDVQLPAVQKRGVNVHDLKYYLNANDEKNFLRCLNVAPDEVLGNVAEDLIEMAAQRDFTDAVTVLLQKCRGMHCHLDKAANVAIERGSSEILRQILVEDVEVGSDMLLRACMELGIPGRGSSQGMKERVECLKMILEKDVVDVRCTDSKGNTPLHYAARADCREAVTLLLERGCYIGHMNNFGIPPVADISVSTLSQYFDNCIQARKERMNEYTIEFDYKCLMPHNTSTVGNRQKNLLNQGEREMDVFRYIADNSGLKHLLKHPLLSSFIYLKWRRIRHLLYLNSAFYIFFYLLLNSYILYEIGTFKTNSSEASILVTNGTTSVNVLQIFTGVMLVILAVREILQLVSSPCHYISSFENWVEAALIILGCMILAGAGTKIAAVAILLSAWELVIMIGKHPRMSTGIEMFKTVSFNFMRFLFLYAFLILAFALAFFTLFKDGDDDNFPDPGHSLFKTIIMLTGEFDANDIPFVSHPVLSRLVFVLFVFLIAIVLFNLLNGLAVSDTADILGKAELVGLISRIQVLAYIENIVIHAPFTHGLHCLVCYGLLHRWAWNPLSFLVGKILLFPSYLKSGKLCIKPYGSLEVYDDELYSKEQTNSHKGEKIFPTSKMDPHIIKQAKEVLLKRGRETEMDSLISEMGKMREKIISMEITLNLIKQRLENNNFNVPQGDEN